AMQDASYESLRTTSKTLGELPRFDARTLSGAAAELGKTKLGPWPSSGAEAAELVHAAGFEASIAARRSILQAVKDKTAAAAVVRRGTELWPRRHLRLLPLLPPVVYAIQRGVREIATIEHTLAEEGTAAARVISYELAVNKEITYPVEPGSEILRVVIHPFKLGAPLPTAPLVAKVRVNVNAGSRPITETFSVPLSSVATRVRAEDAALYVGDPSTFDVDLVGRNEGDVRIMLEALDGADGLLVRSYVRQALDKSEAERRGQKLDPVRAKKL